MKAVTLLSILGLTCAVYAQNATEVAGLVGAFTSAGLTQLVQIASTLNGTDAGRQLLANVTSGDPFLIFAPNNDAWQSAPSNVTGNTTLLTDFFSYHIVPGNVSHVSTNYPNVTVAETLYRDLSLTNVHLEGGKPQVVAWSIRGDNKTHVLNQRNDSTVVNQTTYGNLSILVVDHILNIPETLEATIPTNDNSLSGFETLLQSTQVEYFEPTTNQTANVSFFDALNTRYSGFTLLSPTNSAIDAANGTLQSLASNTTAVNNVLFNHWINGTTLYSPLLTGSSNYTSAAGEPLSFSINSTGQYVTSGNVTARIVQPDVLLPNGVVHIIDTVLLNTDSDSGAASSAISSAASAATETAASQTAAIGFSQTENLGGPSGTASAGGGSGSGSGSGSGNSSGAITLSTAGKGFVVALAGVLAGGWMTIV